MSIQTNCIDSFILWDVTWVNASPRTLWFYRFLSFIIEVNIKANEIKCNKSRGQWEVFYNCSYKLKQEFINKFFTILRNAGANKGSEQFYRIGIVSIPRADFEILIWKENDSELFHIDEILSRVFWVAGFWIRKNYSQTKSGEIFSFNFFFDIWADLSFLKLLVLNKISLTWVISSTHEHLGLSFRWGKKSWLKIFLLNIFFLT